MANIDLASDSEDMMEEVRAINPFASFGETRSTKKLSKKQRKEVRKNKRAEKARMEKEEEEEEAAAARLKQTEDAARNNTALHQRNFTLEEKVSVHSAALETDPTTKLDTNVKEATPKSSLLESPFYGAQDISKEGEKETMVTVLQSRINTFRGMATYKATVTKAKLDHTFHEVKQQIQEERQARDRKITKEFSENVNHETVLLKHREEYTTRRMESAKLEHLQLEVIDAEKAKADLKRRETLLTEREEFVDDMINRMEKTVDLLEERDAFTKMGFRKLQQTVAQ